MISSSLAKSVLERMALVDRSRRELQQISSEALAASKRAIFAYHREDESAAHEQLALAKERLRAGAALVKKVNKLAHEGSFRAAQEEYAEADLLRQYLEKGSLGKVEGIADDAEIYLGGLSDMTGELVRRSVLHATEGDHDTVEHIFTDVRSVVELLMQMDLTGSLRTKLDQAKQNLRKLEEIRYDVSLRGQ
jgi:predicted translin family RNA/ssDNA-binding protein